MMREYITTTKNETCGGRTSYIKTQDEVCLCMVLRATTRITITLQCFYEKRKQSDETRRRRQCAVI